jgi:hypothetical protein
MIQPETVIKRDPYHERSFNSSYEPDGGDAK